MGDHDELGVVGDAAQVLGVTGHVHVVQRGFDLVQDAEGRRVHRQNGEVDADGHQRLLATGQGSQVFDDLARGRHLNFDAAFQHVQLVVQLEAGGAAAEQLGEDAAEVPVNLGKAAGEDVLHLGRQLGNHPGQLGAALLHVLHLVLQEGVALAHLFVFLDGAHVHIAQSTDAASGLGHLAAQVGGAFKGHAERLRVAHGQLVFLPQLGDQLVVFLFGGGLALVQAGHLLAHLFTLVAHRALALALAADAAFLLHPLLGGLADGLLSFADAPGALFLFLLDGADALLVLLVGLFQPLDVLPQSQLPLTALAVTAFQVPDGGLVQAHVLLGGQTGQAGLAQLVGQAGPGGKEAVVASGQLGQLGLQGGDLLAQAGLLSLGLLQLLAAAADGLVQLLALGGTQLGGGLGLADGRFDAAQLALGADLIAARGDGLAGGGGQLGVQSFHLGLQLIRRGLGLALLILQGADLFAQVLDLLAAAEQTGGLAHATTGEGTARVDDLTVGGDDPVAVVQRTGDPAGLLDLVHHDDAAQEVGHDVVVFGVVFHQTGCHPGAAGQAGGVEVAALHGVQRQEGGPARTLVAQESHGCLGGAFAVHHDVLQREAQGGLDGHLIARLHREDAAHRADDAPQPVVLGGLHHGLDAVLVAVHIPFQVGQQLQPLGGGLQLTVQLGGRAVRLLQLLLPAGQLQVQAVFHIFQPGQAFLQGV